MTEARYENIFDCLRRLRCSHSRDELIDFIETEYGTSLYRYILKEWELMGKEELLDNWEFEHGRSLGLIMVNEAQKLQLEDLNRTLNKEIRVRKKHEKRLTMLKQELEEKNVELEKLSFIDGLTSVANRRYFDIKMAEEWNRSSRNSIPISIIMVDIDHFKLYNDTYGHQMGDECLKKIAQLMESSLKRAGEFVARYGGEEFIIVLPHSFLEDAITLAQYLNTHVKSLKIHHKNSPVCPFITISMGVVGCIPQHSDSAINIIKAADNALYLAKKQGRDRVVYSSYPGISNIHE